MIDYDKINRLPHISKRMFIIRSICEKRNTDLEYLFGLFNLYNEKNKGRWFWQKASFTGALKDAYEGFNKTVDDIVRDLKNRDGHKTIGQIESAGEGLEKLITGMEASCNVDRNQDLSYVRGFVDKNIKSLIDDSLRKINNVP
ncbi:MAG: hypothetical protein JW770_00540 [Actinobacteria bacterium]|nr:hypothetical protein [Actinomycetota bacterium]